MSPHSQPMTNTTRFEQLLGRCERLRLHGLPFDELRELGRSYRLHASRLARLRDRDEDPEAVRHLNALCVRAYTFLYGSTPQAHAPRQRFMATFPQLLGRTWQVQAVAWILLLAGMLIGGVLAWRDADSLYAFVPESLGYSSERLDRLVASAAARAEFLRRDTAPVSWNMFFGSYLFVHNTRVGLLGFATGMLAGVPTVLLQLYNGILLGAFASIFLRDPWPVTFLAWILPHGIPELTAITLCCAGGLQLGAAVAVPGRRGRRQALRAAVPPALLLFATAIPLFIVAALMESFVRESALGTTARLGVAGVLAGGLIAALATVRWLAHRVPVDTHWLREITAPARGGWRGSDSAPPR